MYREMRRKDRQLGQEEAVELLNRGEYGVLATIDGTMPYAVPLSYAYEDGSIYFHCAKVGHKLDNIRSNDQVSFCVVGNTKVLPEKFSTAFESVIAFGTVEILEKKEEKAKALKALILKYSSGYIPEGDAYINRAIDETCVVKINVEHFTGKKRGE